MEYDVKPRVPPAETQPAVSEAPHGSVIGKNPLAAIAPNANLGHVFDETVGASPHLEAPPLSFGQASMHVLRPGVEAVGELAGAFLPGAETFHAAQELREGNQTIGGVLRTAGREIFDYAADKSAGRASSVYSTGKALYQYQTGEGSAEEIGFAMAGVLGGGKLTDMIRGWWGKNPKAEKIKFEESLRKDPIAARNALDSLQTANDGPTRKAALRVLADNVDMPECLDWRGNCGNAAKSLILAIKHDAPLTSIPYRKPPLGYNDPNRDFNPDDYRDPGTRLLFNPQGQHRYDGGWIKSELGKDHENLSTVNGTDLRKYLDHRARLSEGQLGILYQQGYKNGKLKGHDLVVTRIDGELVVVNNNGGNAHAKDRTLRSLSEWQEHWSSEVTDARYYVVTTEVFLPGTAPNEPPPLWELKRK